MSKLDLDSKMADSHTRKNIFETYDNLDSGSGEDFQPSDLD